MTDQAAERRRFYGGWPYRDGAFMEPKHMAESSCGPVLRETPEEALIRRVRYAQAHPLRETER